MELLVVLVIVGVLMGIAFPSYQGYVLRSHRAEAQSALLDIAARQERFVAQNNSYTTEIAAASGLGRGSTTTQGGYYNLSVAACDGGNISTCYVITATAAGGQANDTDCKTITYDNVGNKGGTTGNCW